MQRRIYRLQGRVSPVLLLKVHTAGVWKHEFNGWTLSVAIEPWRMARHPVVQQALNNRRLRQHRFLMPSDLAR